jgi:outer membrane protein assembly factor BamB
VIVSPTGSGGPSLAAYDRESGKRVWTGGTDQTSYSSPLLAELHGVPQVLLFTSAGVDSHDPGTGRVLWSFPWNNGRVNCSEPVPNAGGPGRVFVSTEYDKGSGLFQVERSAAGQWSVREIWQTRKMQTKLTTAVVYQGHVYGLDKGILACLDLKSGRRLWKEGRYEHGQVLLAGDLLLVQAEVGEVVLVAPSPDGLRELGRLPALSSKTWNNLALARGRLLVRNDREAACYELPLRKSP